MKQTKEQCAAKVHAGLQPTDIDSYEGRYYQGGKWKLYDAYMEGSDRKQQELQPIVNSHAELLKALEEIKEAAADGSVINQTWVKEFTQKEIEKATRIYHD